MSLAYDVKIIPDTTDDVPFEVLGRTGDPDLMLLQRLYVLLFTEHGEQYRGGTRNTSLLSLLDGANTPPDDVMNPILSLCCADALNALEAEDRRRIASFSCSSTDGRVTGTLVFTDGSTITRELPNV